MRAPTPRTFAAAALVIGSLALTGCGNAVESIAKAGVEKAIEDHAQYVEWAASGLINQVPGRSIEYEFVAAEVQKLANELDVEMMVVDPAFLTDFRQACDRIGFDTWIYIPEEQEYGSGLKIMIHGQGRMGMNSKKALWMPRSLQQLEDLILTKQIAIDDSPVTKWCSGNAAVQPDAQNNRFFVKKVQRGRIDGLVVLTMLAGASEVVETYDAPVSPWDDPSFTLVGA